MILQNGNYVGKYSRKFVRRWVNQIYFLVVQSPPCVLLMEVRPKQFGLRCIATNLVPQTPLCFSPIFTDTQGTKEGRVGESPFFYTDSTNLAGPDMVPWVNSFVNEKSPTLTSINKFLKESSRGNAHSSLKSNNELGAWVITGNIWLMKEFQKGLQTLSFHQEERVPIQIIVRPGISGLLVW